MMQRWQWRLSWTGNISGKVDVVGYESNEGEWVKHSDALAEIKSAEERGHGVGYSEGYRVWARDNTEDEARGAQAERERIAAFLHDRGYHGAACDVADPPAEPKKIEMLAEPLDYAYSYVQPLLAKINELVSVINAMRIAVDNLEAHAGFKS